MDLVDGEVDLGDELNLHQLLLQLSVELPLGQVLPVAVEDLAVALVVGLCELLNSASGHLR